MNDLELDRLLDSWEAPAPPAWLRAGLRERFPHPTRRTVRRPLGWLLAIAIASATLAIGMEQSAERLAGSSIVEILSGWYDAFLYGVQAHRVAALTMQIRDSDPRVFVDGAPAPPLQFRHSTVFDVQIPGDGIYSITFGNLELKGWVRAGRIDGSVIRFQAGTHRVAVDCRQRLMISDAPVWLRRR